MGITARTVGKCVILDCSGKLTYGSATVTLRKAIREAVQNGTSKVVLNPKGVSFIDSSFISEMIGGYAYVTDQGSNLVFLNPSKYILEITALMTTALKFEFCDDEQKALEGCE